LHTLADAGGGCPVSVSAGWSISRKGPVGKPFW